MRLHRRWIGFRGAGAPGRRHVCTVRTKVRQPGAVCGVMSGGGADMRRGAGQPGRRYRVTMKSSLRLSQADSGPGQPSCCLTQHYDGM